MSKYVIDSSTLTSIADAVRAKTGKTATIKVSDIPTEISKISGGGETIPDELFNYSGNCAEKFSGISWNQFIDKYGYKIKTSNITNTNSMFCNNTTIQSIPFSINCSSRNKGSCEQMFSYCEKLENISDITNLYADSFRIMFTYCKRLRYLPNFINCNFSETVNFYRAFHACYSLRSIPESLLKSIIINKANSDAFQYAFEDCYVLDEIRGINLKQASAFSLFPQAFNDCNRVKDVIFATQGDGTPYTSNIKSSTISLAEYVGYSQYKENILKYNSGITADKEVKDDATYRLLKNDPDWFTCDVNYSRYNHDSAVRTINSLPDTSAYLASAGGTNTIKFKGASGANTDGGAINTLTESEIAVATAKGWTVTLV